uniref:Uncharacterized protein n=1 Tax=Physcomitrium patens TaxID=3218 RepID=A0A2K1II17_PHYPA|nr:hypothetical protein PHYPA_027607 [Physcomitrium patens]
MCYEGGIRIHGNGQCHSPSNGAVESEKLSTGTDLDESETDGPRSRSQRTWQDDVKTRSMGSQPLVSLEISRIVSTPSLSPSTQSPGYKSDSSSDTEHRSIESTEDKLAIQEKSQGKGILFVNHTSKGKTDQANPNDIGFEKPWEEPLLAGYNEEELDRLKAEDAKREALELAKVEERELLRQLRELQDLAHCVISKASPRKTIKNSKLKKLLHKTGMSAVFRFLKNPFIFFRPKKEEYPGYNPDALSTKKKVAIPKKRSRLSETSVIFGIPSATTNANLETMREGSKLAQSKPVAMQFATVVSTQRDVEPWTREQYLRKNDRIPDRSNNLKKDDDEFGGIEGNNLMNPAYGNGVVSDYDTDSD